MTPAQVSVASGADSLQSGWDSFVSDLPPLAPSGASQSDFTDSFSSIEDFFTGATADLGASVGSIFSTNSTGVGMNQIISGAEGILQGREGRRHDVYLDSKNILTVGIGHKVLASDNLSLGDIISDAQIDSFFSKDSRAAYNAANAQATDLGKTNDATLLIALLCVNFQLGSGWTSKFYNTWAAIKSGNISDAVNRLYQSAWYQETPDRVNDFVAALQQSYGVA